MSASLLDKTLKPKQLEGFLQRIENTSLLNADLEQYRTPPHIAAHFLWKVESHYGGIAHTSILDLGCGNGILSIGCALLRAKKVVGLDIDHAAVVTAQQNVDSLRVEYELDTDISFQIQDVKDLTCESFRGAHFDSVIMNPPFGTKTQLNIDTIFVQKALLFAGNVYSFHKKSTRSYWLRKQKEWNVEIECLETVSFNIEKCYKFHKDRSRDIEVDFLRIVRV
eukprot:Em0001g1102a